MNEDLLTIIEKRRWLAEIFRNADGEYCQSDRFKALVEDTKLAGIQQEEEEKRARGNEAEPSPLIYELLRGVPQPDPAAPKGNS